MMLDGAYPEILSSSYVFVVVAELCPRMLDVLKRIFVHECLFTLAVEVRFYVVDKGVYILFVVTVHNKSGTLVADQDMLVLVRHGDVRS